MTGTRVSAVTAYTAHRERAAGSRPRGHRVRELVCSYRPVRDHEGRVISVEDPDVVNRFKADSDYARRVEISTLHRALAVLRAAIHWGRHSGHR
jgi:hypothetical protein